jgi:hypothetical protein
MFNKKYSQQVRFASQIYSTVLLKIVYSIVGVQYFHEYTVRTFQMFVHSMYVRYLTEELL